jgi:putative aldouronate transport system substrate-binding protein
MNRKWKKSFLFVFIVVLLVMMVGCSGKNTDTAQQTTTAPSTVGGATTAPTAASEPVTLTIFGGVDSGNLKGAFQDDDVMKELEKRTGVKLDFTSNLNISDPAQKMAVMLAGNDLPDIVIFNTLTDQAKVYGAKQAIPLDELVAKYGPDIQKNAGAALSVSKQLSSDDTHALYYLPGGVKQVIFSPLVNENTWNLRWDLYKQLNYPKLDTLDDLLNVMEQMMKLEPTNKAGKKTYGIGINLSDDWGQLMIDRANYNMAGEVCCGYNDLYYSMDKKQIVPRISDPNSTFWKSVKFYNEAYKRGILDPESATLKFAALNDKYKSGRYFASTTHWSQAGADQQFIAEGSPEKGFVPLMINNNPNNIYVAAQSINGNQFQMFISKTSKNPEAAMKFINYLYTNEGSELLQNGVEGKQYDMVNGVPVVKDSELAALKSDPKHFLQTGVLKYSHMQRFNPPQDPKGYPSDFMQVPDTVKKLATPVQNDFMTHYKYNTINDAFMKIPNYSYDVGKLGSLSAVAGSDIQGKKEQLDAYLVANIAKVIYQKTDADFEKAKNSFLDAYNSKGAKVVFDYFKKSYEDANK